MNKRSSIFVALVHYPVLNKKAEVVATSVTTLDLHDIARISRTYGLDKFYVVTPLEAQHRLIDRIRNHWMSSFGADYNPSRKEAFEVMSVVSSIEDAKKEIEQITGKKVKIIATCARMFSKSQDYDIMKSLLSDDENYLILFGTGWGLTSETIDNADYVLKPIDPGSGYNHLPVRGAFAIIIDRLFGR